MTDETREKIERARRKSRRRRKKLREELREAIEAEGERLDQRLEQIRKNAEAQADGPTQLFDSVVLDLVPRDAKAVGAYRNGSWPTFDEAMRRFPHARILGIAVSSAVGAECLDVEPGDATNDDVVGWIKRFKVEDPVIYTAVSNVAALLATLKAGGIDRDEIRLWSAHYTHRPHLCGPACGFGVKTTADATQFTDKALGRDLDESLCSPAFLA